MGFQPDQLGRSVDLAALLVEIVGKNGLGDLFGQAEIGPIDASAGREIHRPQQFAVGVDSHRSLSAAGVEESSGETHRLEDLERAGMHHRRAVPMERPDRASIRWHGTPRRSSSAVSSSPVGPAPTTTTAGRLPVWGGLLQVGKNLFPSLPYSLGTHAGARPQWDGLAFSKPGLGRLRYLSYRGTEFCGSAATVRAGVNPIERAAKIVAVMFQLRR